MEILYFSVLVAVFVSSVLALRMLIPKLRSMKMGQKILDIGPRWHKSKEGTPTMGGLGFAVPMTVVLLIAMWIAKAQYPSFSQTPMLLTLFLALGNGIIGCIDDLTKFHKKQNEGLTAPQKYALQLAMAGAFLAVLRINGLLRTEVWLPFTKTAVDLGFLYYVFALIFITGIINSVNLTDGIDGLASSVTCVVGVFLSVLSYIYWQPETMLIGAAIIGGTLGFLVYNFNPARVFMGDTGSLFLGGLVAGTAFMVDRPLLIAIAGGIYICEALSDIIQVGCYKLTHRRVFKMAPIHHHFEKCGWSERKIVFVFSSVTALLCIVAYFGY